MPFCVFTDRELVQVGLNESEADARRIKYRLVKMPVSGVLRTRTLSELRCFLKMLIGARSERIDVLPANVPAQEARQAA